MQNVMEEHPYSILKELKEIDHKEVVIDFMQSYYLMPYCAIRLNKSTN